MGANLLHLAQIGSIAAGAFLVASAWQGLLLAALAWLGMEVAPKALPKALLGDTRKSSPGTRFTLWMIVFILAALFPFTTLLRSPASAPQRQVQTLIHAPHLSAIWAVGLAVLWVAASLFSLERLFWSGWRLHRVARSAVRVPGETLSQEIHALLNGRRPVHLSLSSLVDTPIVIGFFHRTIVLPQWLWSKLAPNELTQIVLHEMAHLERGDDWTNLLQKVFRALFPLNPALFWAERQLCRERETACDDAVLGCSISPREYASCLANLAEKSLLHRLQSLAPGAWQRRSELAERVHRILKSNPGLKPLRSRPVVAAFLTALLCAGAALTRCPQLVTFTAIKCGAPLAGASNHAGLAGHSGFAGLASLSNLSSRENARVQPASFVASRAVDAPSAAHLVEAGLRTTVASRRLKPALHHHALRRSAQLQYERPFRSQWLRAALLNDFRPGPANGQNPVQVVFSIYEIAPKTGVTTIQFTTIPSQSGWVILQL